MELGHLNLRGQNIDLLHEAIHQDHGVVWTDGKTIYLAPIELSHGQVVNQKPTRLGKFEQSVKSVHWSCNTDLHSCYMCVVHLQHISLWRVDGTAPKLSFKQVRKLNVQPISQGCLWNPGRDILCTLSKQQCSFFFRHTQNRGSYAFPPLESGKINCGSWSEDGNRLVLCVGAVILVYTWTDIDASISNFTPSAWRVPSLDGSIRKICMLSNSMLVCAAELPLEVLCKNQDTFTVPEVFINNSVRENDNSDIIVPKKRVPSIKDTLFSLPRNPQNAIRDSSQLITVHLRDNRDPQRKCCTGVKGLLTPEILLYESHLRSVIVGSNTQHVIQVYTFTKENLHGSLVKSTEIQLDKMERPKGIGLIPPHVTMGYRGVLLATGVKNTTDSAFLPSSTGSASEVKLKFYAVNVDLTKYRSEKDLNESGDSSESVCSSLSSLESPRQRIKVSTAMETDNSDVIDVKEGIDVEESVVKDEENHHQEDPDLYLSKQKTLTELRDISDTDSEVSPREITLVTQPDNTLKPEIIDLGKNDSTGSDLEIEKVEFSEQKPNFNVDLNVEKFPENSPENVISDIAIKSQSKELLELNSGKNENSGDLPVSGEFNSHNNDSPAVIDLKQNVDNSDALVENEDTDKIEILEQQILEQTRQIEQLSEKVSKLSQVVEETSLVFPTRYQTPDKAERVQIVCRCSNKKTLRKSFLLDNGRLPLEPIKKSFNLETIEVFLDGEPCTVGSNIDGYIPMRFEANSTLIIQGKFVKSSMERSADTESEESESESQGIEEYDTELKNGTVC